MKMSANEELNLYISASDTAEQIVCRLRESDQRDYRSIQQALQLCINNVERIIYTEGATSTFFAPLLRQRQLLFMLLTITENLTQQQTETPKSNNNPATSTRTNDVVKQSLETPKVDGLNDIIGLHEVKKTLRSLVILPKSQPQLFHNRRISNSVLFYGAPGTGKTRLAHAIAAEAKATFHCISAADILSEYVGQTERAIKTLFQHLKGQKELTVLFIDEIDAFCRKRTSHEQDHTRRIKTEFMCQLSKTEDCRNMFILCATNCPWDLDTAILRRFQKRIYIPLPDPFERLQFLHFFTKDVQFADESLNWGELVDKTHGYSGSDLSDLVQNALDMPLGELEATVIWKHTNGVYEPAIDNLGDDSDGRLTCRELCDLPPQSVRTRKLQMKDLLAAANNVTCTVPQSDVTKFEVYNGM